MENKMAALMGFENKRDIYEEMARRTETLQRMVDRNITHYDDVFDLLDIYYQQDWDAFSNAIDIWTPIED
jgi:flagellar protein FlaI